MQSRSMPGDAFAHDVLRIIDTKKMSAGEQISGVGYIYGGGIVTFHVTDKPEQLIRAMRKRVNVVASYGAKGKHAELGPGLYLSGVPEFWMNRSTDKWSFLEKLTDAQRVRLLGALTSELDEQASSHYVSKGEYAYAMRYIDGVREGTYDSTALTSLAGQPYNIKFWTEQFLAPLGIDAGKAPSVVELEIVGRFAELRNSYPSATLLRMLRRSGIHGAYTRPSIATNPELVLWDSHAILDWRLMRD